MTKGAAAAAATDLGGTSKSSCLADATACGTHRSLAHWIKSSATRCEGAAGNKKRIIIIIITFIIIIIIIVVT
ncbi:hypothetical protein EYF80_033817 [Liparis tanakae]|uniref:Uncharacterized protein n=1 Tax=Liparis tanakae TaxID=230148 RepID=A0A4Z2GTC7_9TELE|nr:hypothetical protein EYF80_033817 [Liparis tanakae]